MTALRDMLQLIDLETDIDLKLALRKAKRPRRSERSAKGAETRRRKMMAGLRILAPAFGTALSPSGSSPQAVSPASPLQSTGADDWDQCSACNFILVACDCDVSKGREK